MCISHGGAGKEESAGQGEKGGDGRRDVLRKLSRTDIGRGRGAGFGQEGRLSIRCNRAKGQQRAWAHVGQCMHKWKVE